MYEITNFTEKMLRDLIVSSDFRICVTFFCDNHAANNATPLNKNFLVSFKSEREVRDFEIFIANNVSI